MSNWIIIHNIFEGTYGLLNKSDLKIDDNDIIIIKEFPIGLSEDEANELYIDFLDIIFPSPIIE